MRPRYIGQLRELDLRNLVRTVHHLVTLKNAAAHLAQLVGVDLVSVPHVRVLLTPLLESAFAP